MAEKLIVEGRVSVNGTVVRELGTKAEETDKIVVDGAQVSFTAERVVVMLNKPSKTIVTMYDPEGRAKAIDFLSNKPFMGQGPNEVGRVFPVGRLDYDAQGLLLLTNDGALAERIIHPRYHVPKTYLVKVSDIVEERGLERIRKGIMLKENDGRLRRSLPAEVAMHRKVERHGWYEISVVEGRNHLIKRLFAAVGHPVRRIIRIQFGGLELGNLPEGQWRALEDHEIAKLEGWLEAKAQSGKATTPRAERPQSTPAKRPELKQANRPELKQANRPEFKQANRPEFKKVERPQSKPQRSARGAGNGGQRTESHGIGQSQKAQRRSGQSPRQGASRQGARDLRKGPRR